MKIQDILEAFDYKADITWIGDEALFQIEQYQYKVAVRPATEQEQQTFEPFFDNYETLNVRNIEFSLVDRDETYTQDSVGYIGSHAPKVFAGVSQAVTELNKRHNYDVLLAIAKREHSPTNFMSRVSAYYRIVDFLARKVGYASRKIIDNSNYVVFAVFKPKLLDNISDIVNHVNQHPPRHGE